MANVGIPLMRISYPAPTLPTPLPLDQVDNNTNSSQIYKHRFLYSMNDKYHREDERLKTFEYWPISWLNKNELAMTGMFFTNEGDKVKCYFCEVEIGRWEREDQPVHEHLRWSPNCPLLRRRTTNNIPINADLLDSILPAMSYDICGSNDSSGLERRDHAYSEGHQNIQSIVVQTSSLPNGDGVAAMRPTTGPSNRAVATTGCNYYPEYPQYAIEAARLRSFEDWPRNMKQKPQQLAEAGFFYTGVGDRVRCFSCGGGLKDWDDNDEPWEQHALWLSQCRFVKLIKGQKYIDAVAKKPTSPIEKTINSFHSGDSSPTATATATSAAAPAVTAAAAVEGDVMPQREAVPAPTCDVSTESAATTCTAVAAQGSSGAAGIPEEKLCKICYASEYNTAFLPCGHVVACAMCASSVTRCPLCRKPFTDVMRVYFS